MRVVLPGIFIILIFSLNLTAQTVRPDHPRLYLTQDNIPDIQHKIQTYYQVQYQEFLNMADNEFNGDTWLHVINFAFLYKIGVLPGFSAGHTAQEYGQRARSLLLSLDVDGEIRGEHPDLDQSKFGLPIGYDWLYDLLSQSEKQSLVNKMTNMVSNTTKQAQIFGHMVGIGSSLYVIHGLAFYGDGINDSYAQQIFDMSYDEIFGEYGKVAGKNFSAGNEGGTNSGFDYNGYYIRYLAFPADAWRTATGQNKFPESPFFRYFPQFLTYNLIPWGFPDSDYPNGRENVIYHDHHSKSHHTCSKMTSIMHMLQGWYKNSDPNMVALGQYLLDNRVGYDLYDEEKWEDYVFYYFIWSDPGISPKSPDQLNLPKSILFSGLGEAVMRSGFEDQNDCMVVFKAMPYAYTGGYWSAFDQGSFSIYKRGFLTFGGGSGAHHSYGNSTISRNTMIFDVPGQDYTSSHTDEGGQRGAENVTKMSDLVPGSVWDIGGIKKYRFEENEFDYVYADLTRAYNSTQVRDNYPSENPVKISEFTRELVYCRPSSNADHDYIFVFDRTKTVDAQIKKRWLLHMSYEPQINGTSQNLPMSGQWLYANANEVTITNDYNGADGRLFVKTLLPRNSNIVKIGGPADAFTNILNVHDCDGAKVASGDCDHVNDEAAYYAGGWRIEVQPATPQKEDLFFHVMQTARSSESSMQPVTLIDNQNNYYGGYIDQNVVLFSKTSSLQNQALYDLNASGNVRHVVGNLNPGGYRLLVNGTQVSVVSVGEDGVAFFEYSGGGTFQLTKSNDTIPPGQPSGLKIRN